MHTSCIFAYQCKFITKISSMMLFLVFPLIVTVATLISSQSPFVSLAIAEEGASGTASSPWISEAKKEGKLMIYTSMNIRDLSPLINGFEKKYPFIKTEHYRTTSENVVSKVLMETRANKYIPDIIAAGDNDMYFVKKNNLLATYISPEREFIREEFKDKEGIWTGLYFLSYVIAYNTKLVSPADTPKSYEDLLKARWRGKMGMDSKEIAWFQTQLEIMGRENGLRFMKKLAQQDIKMRIGHILLISLLAAGEYDALVVAFVNQVEELRRNGARIDWVPSQQPIPAMPHAVGISKHAPHPNTAKLYVDYILSEEGQRKVVSVSRLPTRKGIDPEPPRMIKGLKFKPIDTAYFGENYAKTSKEFEEIFIKRK